MKIDRIALGILTLALMSVSCSEQQTSQGGHVSFSLNPDGQVAVVSRSNVSDYTTLPDAGKFTIALTNSNGDEIYAGTLEGYDASTALKTGNYSVKANYGSVADEGFGKPCFSGETSFSIVGGGTASVTIPVSLANAIVKVECTETFDAYYTDYSFSVKTGGGTVIDFPKGETRAAFVDAYMISVSGTLTSQSGKTQEFSKEYRSLSPKTCYTIKFDVSNVGGNSITISFDDTIEDVELTEVELNG